ncbi:MAG: tRNA pseudouridine(54/55) synthase Pus10 [Nanohaloarchaea archaeon]|nr:tRNA pseudouridine(54/55) synthase Pus10 [Candidatus Nanohaloarchaea archaeon]
MIIIDLASKILADGYVCDHCLGRQFAKLLSGYTNKERGRVVRTAVCFALETGDKIKIDPVNLQGFKFRNYKVKKTKVTECKVCEDIFLKVPEKAERVIENIKDYEFDTILVGARLSETLIDNEEALWELVGIDFCESIKMELSRSMGQFITTEIKKDLDRANPQLTVVYDFLEDDFEISVGSLFIYGKYKKLKRGIPQTKWPCSKCRGLGCDSCDWTGKQYKETVEELIAAPVLDETEGVNSKFHGAGREDIDALNLCGREFVLEILEPIKRSVDLKKLEKEINKINKDKVSVSELASSDKATVVSLKEKKADKTYIAVVELDAPIKEADLKKIDVLKGKVIMQQTPERVTHRRADITRERKVLDISCEFVDPKNIRIRVTGEAGLYIKELISSDNGRTEPSVSALLGVGATVTALDVVDIK